MNQAALGPAVGDGARVVDEDVNLRQRGQQSVAAGVGGDVGNHEGKAALGQHRLAPTRDGYLGALVGKASCDGSADARAATGDQHEAPIEPGRGPLHALRPTVTRGPARPGR